MAIFFAIRDGRKDAREGRPAYGWALLTNSEHRRYLLKDGWKGFRNVFVIAAVLDVVYQFIAIGSLAAAAGPDDRAVAGRGALFAVARPCQPVVWRRQTMRECRK